jgi:O-antigen/teichoic acid export membrane protein
MTMELSEPPVEIERAAVGLPASIEPDEVGAPTMRGRAARGAVINAAFLVGLGTVNVLRAVIVAGLVSRGDYGVWSIVLLALGLLVAVKQVAVSDKFIQQREADQELAFQRAFTLELAAGVTLAAAMAAIAPLLGAVYGRGELVAPALVLALMMVGSSLQAPIWIFYRKLDFFRQRVLLAVEPLVGFAITIGLAAAGGGYWSLVVGAVAGSLAGAAVALGASPYPLAVRFDRRTLREYVSFSWPLVFSAVAVLVMAQLAVFLGNLTLGLAGAGAIGLAATISAYADKVDDVITDTIYPVICRIRDRADIMLEAFVKSNRLSLMWGVPFGVGLTLFAADLVTFGIGEKWRPALFLLQVLGVNAALHHIGFNWTAFYRARGETRPIAVVTAITFGGACAFALPLLVADGLDGFAIGLVAMNVATLVARWHYVRRLFPEIGVARYMARALAPTVPAVATVLGVRLVETGPRTIGLALGELAAYVAVTIAATLLFERRLLTEVWGYLRLRPRLRPHPA